MKLGIWRSCPQDWLAMNVGLGFCVKCSRDFVLLLDFGYCALVHSFLVVAFIKGTM